MYNDYICKCYRLGNFIDIRIFCNRTFSIAIISPACNETFCKEKKIFHKIFISHFLNEEFIHLKSTDGLWEFVSDLISCHVCKSLHFSGKRGVFMGFTKESKTWKDDCWQPKFSSRGTNVHLPSCLLSYKAFPLSQIFPMGEISQRIWHRI